MKKVIVIASAVIAILYSIFLIVIIVKDIDRIYNPVYYEMIISKITLMSITIPFLLLTLISLLVIFNRKSPKILRILSVIFSIIFVVLAVANFGGIILYLITGKIHLYYRNIISIVSLIAVVITLFTYIRRALWPAQK